jgi:hypothetical protein
MHPFVWIAAALGGVAVWRRKHLKEDAEKVKTAAIDAKTVATEKAGVAKTAATEKIAAARGGSSAETTEDEAGDAAEAAGDVIADTKDEASSK